MSNVLIEESTLQSIADSIRAKSGKTEKMLPSEMSDEITNLPSGGGDIDKMINKTITEVSSDVSKIGAYAFQSCTELTSANFPNVTSIGMRAFEGCYNLTSIYFPKLTNIPTYAFSNTKFKSAVFPNVTTVDRNSFYNCKILESVDFSKVNSIREMAFDSGYSLKIVIVRSNEVCSLESIGAFSPDCYHFLGTKNSTYNPAGAKDGYFYVPRALVENYKVATNWSTFASQFRALEDYTIDGTIYGELDLTKI